MLLLTLLFTGLGSLEVATHAAHANVVNRSVGSIPAGCYDTFVVEEGTNDFLNQIDLFELKLVRPC